MERTKKYVQKMYDFANELYDGEDVYDIYDICRIYQDIAEEFNLDVAFGVDGCQYGGDEEIYCYVYVNNIGSLVFNWGVKSYTDGKRYKDAVDYILQLEKDGQAVLQKLLDYKPENSGN